MVGKATKSAWGRRGTYLAQRQLQVAVKKISINNKELLSHAILIWLARHFHYMLMNYGWREPLSPSECNWTFINQFFKCQTVWNIKGSCCYFGDESKQTGNLELIEKRIHVDKEDLVSYYFSEWMLVQVYSILCGVRAYLPSSLKNKFS